jgi:tripartite-type tricarboxylate transporter receptor subunit TctC
MGPGVRTDIPYDVIKSFSHVGKIGEVNAVIAVKNDLPVSSLAELVNYAKANPGKLFYGSAGVGSGSHLLAEYIASEAGIKMSHVPYKGDIDVVRELTTGTVDFGIITVTQALPYINDRKFKAIAVTGVQRATPLPNVPTIGEAGIEPLKTMGVYSIYALLGPSGMPPATTQAFNDALRKVAVMPDVTQRFDAIFVKPNISSPAELRAYLESEHAKWRALAGKLNIQFN